jgi:hypothetical protein
MKGNCHRRWHLNCDDGLVTDSSHVEVLDASGVWLIASHDNTYSRSNNDHELTCNDVSIQCDSKSVVIRSVSATDSLKWLSRREIMRKMNKTNRNGLGSSRTSWAVIRNIIPHDVRFAHRGKLWNLRDGHRGSRDSQPYFGLSPVSFFRLVNWGRRSTFEIRRRTGWNGSFLSVSWVCWGAFCWRSDRISWEINWASEMSNRTWRTGWWERFCDQLVHRHSAMDFVVKTVLCRTSLNDNQSIKWPDRSLLFCPHPSLPEFRSNHWHRLWLSWIVDVGSNYFLSIASIPLVTRRTFVH